MAPGRYYRGNDAYHQAGPPPLLLRLLGPLVVLSTLGLLATGILLVLLGEQTGHHVLASPAGFRVSWVTLHQADFAVWAGATGLHLIGRLAPAIVTTVRGARSRIPGQALRRTTIAGVMVLTVPLALALTYLATSWHH